MSSIYEHVEPFVDGLHFFVFIHVCCCDFSFCDCVFSACLQYVRRKESAV
jgi:hypothetical protein